MLSPYHEQYQSKSDEEIDFRIKVKDLGLRQALASLGMPNFSSPKLRIAVLGCGDRRFVKKHEQMFAAMFEKPVEMTTYDVTIEHLQGEAGVVLHDATLPLPGGPFEITYADVLARFIEPVKQYAMMKNAYDALSSGGLAFINFAAEDFDPPPNYEPLPGTFHVDLNALQLSLAKDHIQFQEVPVTLELVPPKQDDKITIKELMLVLRKT